MSRNTKILLVVVGAVLVICMGICVAGAFFGPRLAERMFSRSPQQAHSVGAQIAGYTVPDGYQEVMGMDLLTTKMVAIAPQNSSRGMIFVLVGTPAATMSRAEMEQQLRQAFQQQFNRNTGDMRYVGDKTVTIRGQPVTMTVSESGSPAHVRQMTGGFVGQHGYVLLMVTGAADTWDDNLLNEFVSSIN